jgi:hypothetical protein
MPKLNIKKADVIYRVISNKLPSKGRQEILLCGPEGRVRVEVLDRDKHETGAAFMRTRRGDWVRFNPASQGRQGYQGEIMYRLSTKDTWVVERFAESRGA